MARYRKIDPRIWNDEKFRMLSHEAQRIFFFVLTHPSMTALGAFRISKSGMAEEVGLDAKGFAIPFGELLSKGLLKYDDNAFLIFAPNFLKYNAPENPNVIKSWFGAWDLIPESPLKIEVLSKAQQSASATTAGLNAFNNAFQNVLNNTASENSFETVSDTLKKGYAKPFGKGMPKQEQEQEQEQNINHSDKSECVEQAKVACIDACPENEEVFSLQEESSEETTQRELTPKQRAVRVSKRCPQEKLIDLYHECLPTLPKVMTWSSAERRGNMSARWREMSIQNEFQNEDEGLDFFKRFFEFVSQSKFLMGQIKNSNGRPFKATLDWLMKPNNFAKTVERHYHDNY